MKYLFIIILLLFSLKANACETVCTLENLNQQKQENYNIIMKIINDMFNKEINEDIFFSELTSNNDYDDLFIYKYTILNF